MNKDEKQCEERERTNTNVCFSRSSSFFLFEQMLLYLSLCVFFFRSIRKFNIVQFDLSNGERGGGEEEEEEKTWNMIAFCPSG